MLRRVLALGLVAIAATAASGCGDKQATVTAGESEAIYVTLGNLQYQVQMSRQLNPVDAGDRDLLAGIAPTDASLGTEDLWFGVWVRVTNSSDSIAPTADEFKIIDTHDDEFMPLPVSGSNKLVFRTAPVLANGGQYPYPNSAAANLPTTGAILIFKLPHSALDYRPLELEIRSSAVPGKKASVTLDV